MYLVPIVNGIATISAVNGADQEIVVDQDGSHYSVVIGVADNWPPDARLNLRLVGSDSGTFRFNKGFRCMPGEDAIEDALWGIGGVARYQFQMINGRMEQMAPSGRLP